MSIYIEWECDEEDCPETVKMKTNHEFGGSIPESDQWTPPGMNWASLDQERYPNGRRLCDRHHKRAMDAYAKANPDAVWMA